MISAIPPASSRSTPTRPPTRAAPASRAIAARRPRSARAVHGLTDRQLDTPYRPGGWTVRQVVHHVPDSHMNAYIRFKLALTEDSPTIKPYDEAAWAQLADSRETPIETSLTLLEALHRRWVILLESMQERGLPAARSRIPSAASSPTTGCCRCTRGTGAITSAHITALREREGW